MEMTVTLVFWLTSTEKRFLGVFKTLEAAEKAMKARYAQKAFDENLIQYEDHQVQE